MADTLVPPPSVSNVVKESSKSKGKAKATTRVDATDERLGLSRPVSPEIRDTTTGSSSAGPSRPRSPQNIDTITAIPIDPFEGKTEEEIFKIVTRPAEFEGIADWGIPAEVDPNQASDALKVNLPPSLVSSR